MEKIEQMILGIPSAAGEKGATGIRCCTSSGGEKSVVGAKYHSDVCCGEQAALKGSGGADKIVSGKLEKCSSAANDKWQGHLAEVITERLMREQLLQVDVQQLPAEFPAEVKEATGYAQRAVRETIHLPEGAQTEKTIYVTRTEQQTLESFQSGWARPTSQRFTHEPVQSVADHAQDIGYEAPTNTGRDGKVEGGVDLSHAEKQGSTRHPNVPGGLSNSMCDNCVTYFQHEAAGQNEIQYVADPKMARAFHPNGRIVEYHYDGKIRER